MCACLLLVEGDIWCDVVGDEHGHHQAVDGDDTRHDHRDDGLHDQLRTHHRHGGNARAALGCAICCAQGWGGKERLLLVRDRCGQNVCERELKFGSCLQQLFLGTLFNVAGCLSGRKHEVNQEENQLLFTRYCDSERESWTSWEDPWPTYRRDEGADIHSKWEKGMMGENLSRQEGWDEWAGRRRETQSATGWGCGADQRWDHSQRTMSLNNKEWFRIHLILWYNSPLAHRLVQGC